MYAAYLSDPEGFLDNPYDLAFDAALGALAGTFGVGSGGFVAGAIAGFSLDLISQVVNFSSTKEGFCVSLELDLEEIGLGELALTALGGGLAGRLPTVDLLVSSVIGVKGALVATSFAVIGHKLDQ